MAPYRPNLLGKHRARVAAVLDVDSHSARLEQEGYGVADIAWRFAVPLFDVGGNFLPESQYGNSTLFMGVYDPETSVRTANPNTDMCGLYMTRHRAYNPNQGRCITRGLLGSAFPNSYNSAVQIFQSPSFVVIHYEMIHDSRVIPLDGRPHVASGIRQWMGDSRGHWDGDTLVVDVTAFNGLTWFDRAGNFAGENLHVVERYTLSSPSHLTYEATIEDPDTFTRPWKISFPLYRRMEQNIELLDMKCVEFTEEYLYGSLRKPTRR